MTPRVLTVRQSGSNGGWPIYAIAQYVAVYRKKDGVPTWRFDGDVYPLNRAYKTGLRKLPDLAQAMDVPYCKHIRNGDAVLSAWRAK